MCGILPYFFTLTSYLLAEKGFPSPEILFFYSIVPIITIPTTMTAMAAYLGRESFSFKKIAESIIETTQYAEIIGAATVEDDDMA